MYAPDFTRVVAIDPGYARMGVAVLEKNKKGDTLIFSDCVETNASENISLRLYTIGNFLEKIFKKHNPDLLAIESVFFGKNQKTAIHVAAAWGVAIYAASKNGIDVKEITPLQVKMAVVGYGRGTKEQVAELLKKTLVIKKDVRFDDEMDAIAVGVAALADRNVKNFLKTKI